jgi:cytochrome c peroxidase
MNSKKIVLSILIVVLTFACSKDKEDVETSIELFSELNLPEDYFNYENIILPEHYLINDFPSASQNQNAAIEHDNTPSSNLTTDAGATLGRVLFYDKKLSANGTIACASCHNQANGFSDPLVLSDGFDGGKTRRHSMGLSNARFFNSGKFFWDERAETLEDQVLMPFQDPVEMGLTLEQLEQIVSEQSYYAPLFEDAFGSQTINSDKISKALAQFIRSIVSFSAKYDQGRAQVSTPLQMFPNFTTQENEGKSLFFLAQNGRINCAGCHVSEAFLGPIPNNPFGTTTSVNNGLDAISTTDLGIFETTSNSNDIGKFKVPSLRNIGVRAPYMHDGRFESLEEVIEHYSSGIQNHPNLAPPLRDENGDPIMYNFTDSEKSALVAFLNTLTDQAMLNDEKYSNPFK